jgi:2-polyprenyl-6-methoxyphenol hydroxylase-like FAD-dependent oxidoreductase
MEDTNAPLRVIIIGGAVAGLTLALCLEAAGVDYVLLEKHDDICTNIGGSLALQPHGSRVLDQLGVYQRLERWTNDVTKFHTCNIDDTYTSLFPTWTTERCVSVSFPTYSILSIFNHSIRT